ncbi:PEP-CTERM sorting domain-containing protein [Chitiniphilus purpureus]|uniref:PEP-CTERM sorting domain-containing protein n=1 Tax=Chitiniphilus purpureus TaxID=2981137 RepID=A0ABY6DN10_9NEIS|nr:PEP-CTERM sorting domain-containing protein [Chitiniphilus sp. CD1]UXY15747.1 PEP-CTERM sorting domain-containing protein [Chitiniphilus sp. CD1]
MSAIRYLAGMLVLLGTLQTAHANLLHTNLIHNGDAERGLAGWRTDGAIETVSYAAGGGFPTMQDPGPLQRGDSFFAGGVGAAAHATQTRSLAGLGKLIDAGALTFSLGAYLGGYASQNDHARFTVRFLDVHRQSLGEFSLTGPSAMERGDRTGLWAVEGNGWVPVGARNAEFTLDLLRTAGSYNDGYADNLTFSLAPIPEPHSYALIGLGMIGLLFARRRRFPR